MRVESDRSKVQVIEEAPLFPFCFEGRRVLCWVRAELWCRAVR